MHCRPPSASGAFVLTPSLPAAVTYDAAGQRKTAINGVDGTKETYNYSEDGYLTYTLISPTPTGTAVLRAKNIRDQMGRVTNYYEYLANGVDVAYSRTNITYNNKSQVTQENGQLWISANEYRTTTTTYDYNAESYAGSGVYTGAYQGGVVTHSRTTTVRHYRTVTWHTQNLPTTDTRTAFVWWDDARQDLISFKPDAGQATTWTTDLVYDKNGRLKETHISDGHPRNFYYTTDLDGQIRFRRETNPYAGGTSAEVLEYYYYLEGVRIGDISNNGAPENDYALTITRRNYTQTNQYAYGSAVSFADFDQSYEPINGRCRLHRRLRSRHPQPLVLMQAIRQRAGEGLPPRRSGVGRRGRPPARRAGRRDAADPVRAASAFGDGGGRGGRR